MRDALGGTVNFVIIVVFIVIVLGYLAFNVNYTKAFRMKNNIISEYENSDGKCFEDESGAGCKNRISQYAKQIGYKLDRRFSCPSGYQTIDNSYCIKTVYVDHAVLPTSVDDLGRGKYIKVITKVNVSVPIIDNMLDMTNSRIFQIRGDSKIIVIK